MQELITHKETGFIVPIRNEFAIANEMIEFNGMSKESIEIIVKKANKKVKEQHNTRRMVSGMEKLYLSVINS
jgi:colanic acid/amylovoran biosynthesis glycosyltransferase